MPPTSASRKECDEASSGASSGASCPEPGQIAVFDLDGTLTTTDTLLPILLHYGLVHRRLLSLACMPCILGGYALRFLGARAAKEKLLILFFGGQKLDQARSTITHFLERWLPAHRHPIGMERVRFHLDAGHRVILVSASPDLYVPLIAEMLGVKEWLCTEVVVQAGRITGTIQGENLAGEAKVRALAHHLGSPSQDRQVTAYGNSKDDLPLLKWASAGFLVTKRNLARI